MKNLPDISIVGYGNIARHLAHAFFEKNIQIQQIIGRDANKGQPLAQSVNAKFCLPEEAAVNEQSLFFVALADDVALEFTDKILLNKHIAIVHTSGTLPSDLLKGKGAASYGVFYPFQTYSGEPDKTPFKNIPLVVEASDKTLSNQLHTIAKLLESNAVELNQEDRLYLHLSGVFTNNFTNFMIGRVIEFLKEKRIDPALLEPLIKKTFENLQSNKPLEKQTGPAKRGDKKIMQKHLNVLKEHADLNNIYKMLSDSIESYYTKKSPDVKKHPGR